MRRIIFVDDRGAAPAAVVDNDVNLIAAEPRVLDVPNNRPGDWAGTFWRGRWGQKIVDILLNVALDRVEIPADLGQIIIAGARLFHQLGDRNPRSLTVEHLHRIAVLASPKRPLPHRLF